MLWFILGVMSGIRSKDFLAKRSDALLPGSHSWDIPNITTDMPKSRFI
jgi:hypothetical protein